MMRDDPSVATLVEAAARGEESAWHAIVRRHSPLLWSTCHRYRLTGADADDVAATVWLRLITNLPTIRQPQALPGWLSTTAHRECLLFLRNHNRQIPTDDQQITNHLAPEPDTWLLIDERRIALRDAITQLPHRDQQLLGAATEAGRRSVC